MKRHFNEKSFYIYKFLNDCLPIYALYAVHFREKELSLTEISLLFSFWSLVALVSEVPSGVLADRWNRKYMLCAAAAMKSVCYAVWCFSNTFAMFALGFLFWGISGSFMSGTEEGLIYDNLKSENREDSFSRVYGKGRFYASLGNITGFISAGILANFISISAISLVSGAIPLINIFFISRLREKNYYSERLEKEHINYFKTLSGAVGICVKNSKILFAMILLVLVISVTSYSDEYDSLIIHDFGLGYIWISVMLGVRFLGIAMGERFAAAVGQRLKSGNSVYVLSGAAGALMLAFSAIWNQFAIPVFGLSCMAMTIAEVMQINAIQKEINEEGRTTVMSIYSLFQNLAMIAYCSIYALLTNAYSLKTCYIIVSIYCAAGAALLFAFHLMRNRRKR